MYIRESCRRISSRAARVPVRCAVRPESETSPKPARRSESLGRSGDCTGASAEAISARERSVARSANPGHEPVPRSGSAACACAPLGPLGPSPGLRRGCHAAGCIKSVDCSTTRSGERHLGRDRSWNRGHRPRGRERNRRARAPLALRDRSRSRGNRGAARVSPLARPSTSLPRRYRSLSSLSSEAHRASSSSSSTSSSENSSSSSSSAILFRFIRNRYETKKGRLINPANHM